MIKPKGFRCWAFPKGKQTLGESLQETAIRETLEEVGYTVPELSNAVYIDVDRSEMGAGMARLYVVHNVNWSFPFHTRCKGEVDKISWIPVVPNPTRTLSSLAASVWPELLDHLSTLTQQQKADDQKVVPHREKNPNPNPKANPYPNPNPNQNQSLPISLSIQHRHPR